YRDSTGKLIGFVLRRDYIKNGEKTKETPMIQRVQTPDGELVWARMHFASPRPLYGAEILARWPEHDIIVVEGEKAADAARRIFAGRNVIVVSWAGGSPAVSSTDWNPLAGRHVVLWPDADVPGYRAVLGHEDGAEKWKIGLAERLISLGAKVEFI